MAEEESSKKSKKGLIWGIIGAVAAVVIVAIIAIVLNLNQTPQNDVTAKISYTNAFFIYSDNKYTLWDAEGKRLNNDEYSYASNFVGGYAYVKKDNQYGVVHDDGKMSIEFGKFGNIESEGGLYVGQDGNTKEYFLMTGSGKVLARGTELKTDTSNYASGFASVEVDHKIRIFNYAGILITEVQVADDADAPDYNNSDDFGIMYYANHNYLFDTRSGKLLGDFSGERYSFDDVSDDRSKVLLEDYEDTSKYKLFADGKFYDLNEMEYYSFVPTGGLIGYDSGDEIALLDKDYKVARKVGRYIELKDTDNFAVDNGSKVEIYRNGEKIKEFENAEVAQTGVMYEDLYAIADENKAMFYNLDGSVGINHEFKRITRLFNEFHLAVVADTENEYYLIDAKGNRVTDYTARNFVVTDGGFEVKNNDGKYAIADKTGKLVTGFDYDEVYYRSNAKPRNIWTADKDDCTSDVYDVDSGQLIAEGLDVRSIYDNYFTARTEDGKTNYFTYQGKLFFTGS